jgi:hypothetical protein
MSTAGVTQRTSHNGQNSRSDPCQKGPPPGGSFRFDKLQPQRATPRGSIINVSFGHFPLVCIEVHCARRVRILAIELGQIELATRPIGEAVDNFFFEAAVSLTDCDFAAGELFWLLRNARRVGMDTTTACLRL